MFHHGSNLKSNLRKFLITFKSKFKQNFSLTLMFALITFCILLVSMVSAVIIMRVLYYFGAIINVSVEGDINGVLILAILISVFVGITITVLAIKFPLRPLTDVITQIKHLSQGDYKASLHFRPPLDAIPSLVEVENSFNKLACELESTEMLRSDFINNFSHEFKTPIVSIAGFAKLLKKDGLTEEQKTEYIGVIEEESIRLSNMATNVLNLTKVENQTILTDISLYNLSEQIRSAVLLLERSWTKKNIELRLEFGEYNIEASEELLKQVWINLIDNAIKYSPDGGFLEISIEDTGNSYTITVSNLGEISPESKLKIWNKFYQSDESHSSIGNGLGLAIVRRVVRLHDGAVNVTSENGIVSFFVTVPKHNSGYKISY